MDAMTSQIDYAGRRDFTALSDEALMDLAVAARAYDYLWRQRQDIRHELLVRGLPLSGARVPVVSDVVRIDGRPCLVTRFETAPGRGFQVDVFDETLGGTRVFGLLEFVRKAEYVAA